MSKTEKTTEELVAEYFACGGKVHGPKRRGASKKKEISISFMNEYSSR